uniref:uncharacterized protein isoform X1 n=2 Tax=Myxine glutinosa TaxID=7769 RepID=UPI00358E591B
MEKRRGHRRRISTRERLQMKVKEHSRKREGKYSIAQLLEKVQECIESCDVEMARIFCERALEMAPDDPQVLDIAGSLYAELGLEDKARSCLLHAIDVTPDKGHAKYMYLGQLSSAQEAVVLFSKGVELMQRSLVSQSTRGACVFPDKENVTPQEVSSAYCSIAEIYLTDLCIQEEAAERCKEALDKALETCPNNVEALQLMASFLISSEKPQEGKRFLMQSLEVWLPGLIQKNTSQEQSEVAGEDNQEWEDIEEEDEDILQNLPAYELRITTAKLLLEIEEFTLAVGVLERLLEEQDDVVQVWYLLGWVNFLQSKKSSVEDEEDDRVSSRTALLQAKKLAEKQCYGDDELMSHMEQLLGELGPAPDDDEDENEVTKGELEPELDVSSEDDNQME